MRNSLYLLVFLATILSAQSGEHPVSPSLAKLKPLHWMIGQWKGEGTCMGMPYTEEFTVSLVYEGHFLRADSKTFMDGKLVWSGTGITGYDLDKDQLTTFVFGMDGGIGRATFKQGEKENIWILEGSTSGLSPFKKYTETLTITSADEFSLALVCTEGMTNADLKAGFKRVKETPPPAKDAAPARDPLPKEAPPARDKAPVREPALAAAALQRDIILPRVRAR